ncbi:MAG: 50S ribosomal protein L24 [Planctomycetes bacterium]|nr:50S ribosomal protein L24 [Planctomycetota bacterium]
MAARILLNDEVVVISGKDRGKRGRVLRIIKDKNKLVVDGVNIITRHLKRNPQNPSAGGRVQRPAPIAACKVMPWSSKDGKGVRIAFKGDGREKARTARQSGSALENNRGGRRS